MEDDRLTAQRSEEQSTMRPKVKSNSPLVIGAAVVTSLILIAALAFIFSLTSDSGVANRSLSVKVEPTVEASATPIDDYSPRSITLSVTSPICGMWQASSGASLPGLDKHIDGIAVVSADDIWAVGSRIYIFNYPPASNSHAIIEHWDGHGWRLAFEPKVDNSREIFLTGVAAASADDVWAVGTYRLLASGMEKTLAMHWNGKEWQEIPSPSPGKLSNELDEVVALAADNVWAVGNYEPNKDEYHSLLLHWDGKAWGQVNVSGLEQGNSRLHGIAARADDDMWAVGDSWSRQGEGRALTIHWDGRSWQQISTPAGGHNVELNAVVIAAADNVWAVGQGVQDNTTMHWNGKEWQMYSDTGTYSHSLLHLYALTIAKDGSVWAGGSSWGMGAASVIRWDGKQWADVPIPRLMNESHFYAMAGDEQGHIWAVGSVDDNEDGPYYMLMARFTPMSCADVPPTSVVKR